MRKLKHVGKNQIEKYKAGRETEFDEIAESMTALGQAIQQEEMSGIVDHCLLS